MSDALQKLFGSEARLKLLRLFLFNPKQSFTISDIAHRSRVSEKHVRLEVATFLKMGLVQKLRRKGKSEVRFGLNTDFSHVAALQNLLLNAPARSHDVAERVRGTGAMKMVILSGVFMGEWEGQLDILVIGDRVNERKLRERIKRLEAEIGKELRYALLRTDDFFYRLNMNDKLVRDVLDYPHRVALDRINTSLKFK